MSYDGTAIAFGEQVALRGATEIGPNVFRTPAKAGHTELIGNIHFVHGRLAMVRLAVTSGPKGWGDWSFEGELSAWEKLRTVVLKTFGGEGDIGWAVVSCPKPNDRIDAAIVLRPRRPIV